MFLPNYLVVATAGHIDHGKTALVRALTGIETDRLVEEKSRGITIDLGFAHLGDHIAIIDVPGHERFIKTMAAGVSTVDLGLLVVAADDGVMPQTREHLAILQLLGVPRIFVVLTKISLADQSWMDLVEEEIRILLPQEYAPTVRIFRCDSLSGQGIDDLKKALLGISSEHVGRTDSGVFRLPVDRAFSLKGFGTVAAGTILGGRVAVGDRLVVMPEGQEVRVRGMQSQGADQPVLGIGQRAALNLTGDKSGSVQRGDWICAPGAFLPTDLLNVHLHTMAEAQSVKNRDRVHVHLGTTEVLGRIVLLGADVVAPNGEAFAQIILENRTIAVRGDRFIIRRYSPVETLGGGVILDPLAVRIRRSDPQILALLKKLVTADTLQALAVKIASTGNEGLSWSQARAFSGVTVDRLEALASELQDDGAIVRLGSGENVRLFSSAALKATGRTALIHLADYHRLHPDQLGLTRAHLISELAPQYPPSLIERVVDDLLSQGLIALEKTYLRLPEHRLRLGSGLEDVAAGIQRKLEEAGLSPPSLENLERTSRIAESDFLQVINTLLLRGSVVRLEDGSLWAAQSLRVAWEIVHNAMAGGTGLTIGQLRDALGCPRRQAVILLEHFDALGLTRRQDDQRLHGPNFNDPANALKTKNT